MEVAKCFFILLVLTCCASYEHTSGVDNIGHSKETPVFIAGVSTQKDVIEAFGAPSQIITLHERPVFLLSA